MSQHSHQTPTVSLACVGLSQPLYVSGDGYKPGQRYIVEFFWPGSRGEGVTSTVADPAGHIGLSTYGWWVGDYKVEVALRENETPIATATLTVA